MTEGRGGGCPTLNKWHVLFCMCNLLTHYDTTDTRTHASKHLFLCVAAARTITHQPAHNITGCRRATSYRCAARLCFKCRSDRPTAFLGWWKDEVRKNDGLTQRPNSSEKVVSLSTLSKVAVKQSKAKQSKALHVNVTVFYLGFPNKPNIVWLCYLHTLAPSLEQNKAMYGTFLWSLCSCWRQVKWRHCDWLKCVGGEGTMSTSDYHHHHHHRHHFIRSKSNTCMSIKWTVQ